MTPEPEPTVVLEQWRGTWTDDDPHANLKDDVVALCVLDPLETLEGMLHVGGTTVERMHQACLAAEEANTDQARLDAYNQLREMVSWLRIPFEEPDLYS